MLEEFISTGAGQILIYFIASLVGVLALTWLGLVVFKTNPVADLGIQPTQPTVKEPELSQEQLVLKDSRYERKKPSRQNKDVNRFGRWSLQMEDGRTITRIGFLKTILAQEVDVKTYREIK